MPPIFDDAVPVMCSSYSTVLNRWWFTALPEQREDLYVELQAPYAGDAPMGQLWSFSGYTYDGFRNSIESVIPLKGMHIERYKLKGTWAEVS